MFSLSPLAGERVGLRGPIRWSSDCGGAPSRLASLELSPHAERRFYHFTGYSFSICSK